MALAPRPTSLHRSRSGRVDRCLPSRGREMLPPRTFARSLGAAWAGGSDEMPPEPLDAAIIFADCGRPRAPGTESRPQGRSRRLRGHPYERHPQLSLSAAVGRAADRLGGQPHSGRMDWISCGWRRTSASSPIPQRIRLTRPIRPSPISVPGGSKARQFFCPERGRAEGSDKSFQKQICPRVRF